MSTQIFLDGTDITSDLQKQASLDGTGTFLPSGAKWFNLLPIIDKHQTLKENFFTANIHTLTIKNDSGVSNARMFIKAKYTARNR